MEIWPTPWDDYLQLVILSDLAVDAKKRSNRVLTEEDSRYAKDIAELISAERCDGFMFPSQGSLADTLVRSLRHKAEAAKDLHQRQAPVPPRRPLLEPPREIMIMVRCPA